VIRQGAIGFALVALGLARDPGGCGAVDDPDGGTNAPCTRNSDCRSGLICSDGVCAGPDSGNTPPKNDGGAVDSGTDSAKPEDASTGD
jgi:hypothetical protein